jgi:phosphoglycerol transferase MdoB-like AlkP superfamily enzyme
MPKGVVDILWFILLLISLPLSAVTKYFNFATFSKKKIGGRLYVVILSRAGCTSHEPCRIIGKL